MEKIKMSLTIHLFSDTKKEVMDIKRIFRNSFDSSVNALSLYSREFKSVFNSISFFLYKNEKTTVRVDALDDCYAFTIYEKNSNGNNSVTLYIDEELKEKIINKLVNSEKIKSK